MTLLSNYKSFKNLVKSSDSELASCPGLGPQKVKRIRDAFTTPFLNQGVL